MFGVKNCKECKEDIPRTFEEFVLKRENDRIKLHIRYICFITISIVVWLIATGTANNKEFYNWVSFAGTITSIILSVLAIIMSITGEGKTEHIKDQLEDTANHIRQAQCIVGEINKSIEDNLGELNSEIKRLSDKIDDVPDKTAKKVTTYRNENMLNNVAKGYNKKLLKDSWEKSKQ